MVMHKPTRTISKWILVKELLKIVEVFTNTFISTASYTWSPNCVYFQYNYYFCIQFNFNVYITINKHIVIIS